MTRSGVLRVVVAATTIVGLVLAATLADFSAVLFFGAYAGIGAYLAVRRPANPIGWLLMATGWGLAIGSMPVTAPLDALLAGRLTPLEAASVWGSAWGWGLAILGIFGVTLVFPRGQLPDGRHGWWSRIAIVAMVGLTIMLTFGPNVTLATTGVTANVPNPMAIPALVAWRTVIPEPIVLYWSLATILVGGVIAFVLRYRRSVGLERLQYRWLVAAMAFVAIVTLLWAVATQAFAFDSRGLASLPVIVGYPSVPIAILIAITRYRLYDIDRIISRTIAYAGVTVVLFAVFAGVNLTLRSVLDPLVGGGPVTVAASTLAIAALFTPLRTRLQRVVDRRFNRSRADAELTVGRFAERLRDQLDLDAIALELTDAAVASVEPATASFWLRPAAAARVRPGIS